MDLAERLLYFRALPAGGTATAQELMPLAEAARDVFFRKGTLLFERDHPPARFICLTEGAVELSRGDLVIGVLEAPAVVGIRAVMARVVMPYTVRALDDLAALEVASDQFLQTIEDDFALWRRQLKFQNTEFLARIKRAPREHLERRRVDLAGLPTHRTLDLVERMLLVRRMGLFGRGSVNALAELSQQLVEESFPKGKYLFRRDELATGPRFVVRGAVEGRFEDGQTVAFGPGSVLGGPETMAESPHLYDAVATEPCAVLRLDLESFFDVVEDNTEIASAFLSGTARVVLDLDVERMVREAEARRAGKRPSELARRGRRRRRRGERQERARHPFAAPRLLDHHRERRRLAQHLGELTDVALDDEPPAQRERAGEQAHRPETERDAQHHGRDAEQA